MKGLILSGGKGTRLRPLTYTRAKQLVPVANRPVLFYGIEAIREAGIYEVGIVVGDTRQEIEEAVGDGSRWGISVTYIQQDAPLGLAHAVMVAEDFLRGTPFVMYLGDNLIKDGITGLVDEYRHSTANSQILLARVPNPSQFGVAELVDGRVVRLVEKPQEPKSDLALVGVYMFDGNIFEAVRNIKPSFRNELEITDAIQYLIDAGYTVEPHVVNGWWKDTGKLEDMLEANRMILDTLDTRIEGEVDGDSVIQFKVRIGKGASITRSTIRGPAIIGDNCAITDSFIGPFTSIQHDTEITGSEVEHSIILENSVIRNIDSRIEDSLIGRNVAVRRCQGRPKVFRLVLGDRSDVEIM
ncbi:glucose-1-phosphate thymidylyltransferase [bacterium]|nr:glucose-1-phosphate thymidylyltransferase [candidate division CSSED10-310 bacterium]